MYNYNVLFIMYNYNVLFIMYNYFHQKTFCLDLVGIKKSQLANYKNIIKNNKIDDLKKSTLREVIRCIAAEENKFEGNKPEENRGETQKVDLSVPSDEYMINEIENEEHGDEEELGGYFTTLVRSSDRSKIELSFGYDHEIERTGARQVYVPEEYCSFYTHLSLKEAMEHYNEKRELMIRIKELERKVSLFEHNDRYNKHKINKLDEENQRLREEIERLKENKR